MAEIKSTMDIIMERTRSLRMTEDEKRAFKEQETAGKLKGLVQRCLDGAIDLTRFHDQVTVLKNEARDDVMVGRLLEKECLDRIELGKDNERIFGMIEEVRLDVPGIKEKLKEFEEQVQQEKVVRESRLIDGLKEKGVSGSAVIPNIGADPGWNEYVGEMTRAFKEKAQGEGYKVQRKA